MKRFKLTRFEECLSRIFCIAIKKMMKKIKNQREEGLNLTFKAISSGKEFSINDKLVQTGNTIFFRHYLTECTGVCIKEIGMLHLPKFVDYSYFITSQYFPLFLSHENHVFFF